MIFYPIDFVIERVLENELSREQWKLKQFTGRRFERQQAAFLWERITDHKWYVSERLGRDIGLKVAAIDYLDNIHEERRSGGRRSSLKILGRSIKQIAAIQ